MSTSANDMNEHKGTYSGFIGMLKWSVPLIAVIALVIVVLIAS